MSPLSRYKFFKTRTVPVYYSHAKNDIRSANVLKWHSLSGCYTNYCDHSVDMHSYVSLAFLWPNETKIGETMQRL